MTTMAKIRIKLRKVTKDFLAQNAQKTYYSEHKESPYHPRTLCRYH